MNSHTLNSHYVENLSLSTPVACSLQWLLQLLTVPTIKRTLVLIHVVTANLLLIALPEPWAGLPLFLGAGRRNALISERPLGKGRIERGTPCISMHFHVREVLRNQSLRPDEWSHSFQCVWVERGWDLKDLPDFVNSLDYSYSMSDCPSQPLPWQGGKGRAFLVCCLTDSDCSLPAPLITAILAFLLPPILAVPASLKPCSTF